MESSPILTKTHHQPALSWTEKTASDGTTRVGKSERGTKRIEKHVDSDGVSKTWYYRADGKLEYFEQLSARGVLQLESHYDQNGIEKQSGGYADSGFATFRNDYDPNGNLTRQAKWSDNGMLLQETEFRNGTKHGTASLFSPLSGHLLSRINYRNDRPDGLSEIFYDTPQQETIQSRTWYQDGQNEGEYSNFHANGRLAESGEFRERRRAGSEKCYYDNGNLKSLRHYVDGELHGDSEEYDENGRLRRKTGMKNGNKHGLELSYIEDGQMQGVTCYVDGKWAEDTTAADFAPPDGVFELFHDNGKLKSHLNYQQGLLHGEFRYFDEEGRLREAGQYAAGHLVGQFRRYQENGLPSEDMLYLNGTKSGKRTRYFDSGQVKGVDEFKDDVIIATRQYYENGLLWWSRHFPGQGLCKLREYDDSGLLLLDAELLDNRWHGWVREYSGDGAPKYVAQYAHGLLEGTRTLFWPNGRPQRKLFHQKGRELESVSYNRYGNIVRITTFHPDGSVISDDIFTSPAPETIDDDMDGIRQGSCIGEYEVVLVLGRGGMGEVYLARENSSGKLIAIKTVLDNDQAALIRFLAEARALAKIKHDNVIAILGVGNHAGTPYIAMEYVEGWTLASLIGNQRLSVVERLQLFRQIVLGVQAAHNMGILHRDLKPANILVSEQLSVKVIDFGIAQVPVSLRLDVAAPSAIIGSVTHLSPEIAAGQAATVQTDVYGLGIILFELLTGQIPHRGSNMAATLEKIISEPLQFPPELDQDLPAELVNLVLQMTAKNPADRLRDCEAVLLAFGSLNMEL